MNDAGSVWTYIIHTESDEYYCGKTNNIDRRLEEHRTTHSTWFCKPSRRTFLSVMIFDGDFEKSIKRSGVKFIFTLLESLHHETN